MEGKYVNDGITPTLKSKMSNIFKFGGKSKKRAEGSASRGSLVGGQGV